MNKSFTLIEMQIVIAIIGILECFASGHALKSSNISLQKRALFQSFVTKLNNRKQCALKPYLMNVQISNPLLLEIPILTLLTNLILRYNFAHVKTVDRSVAFVVFVVPVTIICLNDSFNSSHSGAFKSLFNIQCAV